MLGGVKAMTKRTRGCQGDSVCALSTEFMWSGNWSRSQEEVCQVLGTNVWYVTKVYTCEINLLALSSFLSALLPLFFFITQMEMVSLPLLPSPSFSQPYYRMSHPPLDPRRRRTRSFTGILPVSIFCLYLTPLSIIHTGFFFVSLSLGVNFLLEVESSFC